MNNTLLGTRTKVFCAASSITAVVVCLGMCAAISVAPSLRQHYTAYILFLLVISPGVGFLISRVADDHDSKTRLLDAGSRVAELELELESLEQDAERREEFIASFAHELKTPLTAIIGYADMLRSKDMAPKSRFTAAGYIFSEGRRLEALSLKLMDIIVAGRAEFEKKKFDAGYFIREVAAVSVPSTGGDGLALEIRWDIGEITVEPDLFKTMLLNLVDNARKASRPGQNVELYGKREPEGYAFYVRDYGRGMKPEDIPKIAEPFYMVDKSRARSQNSAGLGLALCSRIAALHNTKLEYSSELGKGTIVRVLLPNDKDAAE